MEVFKLVAIGDSGAGKTCLIVRFCDNDYEPSFAQTVGVDFRIRTVGKYRIQIWDTAGQERFRAITNAYYRGAQAVLLVFALNSRESFLRMPQWLSELRKQVGADASGVALTLVGTKCDLEEERTVSAVTASTWAASEGMQYCEVSAKTGQGVDECFAGIVARCRPTSTSSASGGGVEIGAPQLNSSSCC